MSEVKGTIIHIGQTETVGSAGTFKKRQVVIETDEQYKQQIPVDFVQDKTSMLDQFAIGQNVSVSINIRGNSFNGKWYVNLNGWRISSIGETHNAAPVEDYQRNRLTSSDNDSVDMDDSQDLPF